MAVNSNPRSDYRAGDSAYGAVAVGSGDDTTNLTPAARGVVVIGAGSFDLVTYDPATHAEVVIPYRNVAANTYHPLTTLRVKATNLTATLYYLY